MARTKTARIILEAIADGERDPEALAALAMGPADRSAIEKSLDGMQVGDHHPALIRGLLSENAPYGAEVTFDGKDASSGWNAPPLSPWLERSLAHASESAFGKPPAYMGEGGSIPFMAMLGERFPNAQFVVTGVLGPHSNAHGPNEFLHIPTGRRITQVIAQVLADHHARAAKA